MKKILYKVNVTIPTSFSVLAFNEDEAKAILEKECKEQDLPYKMGTVEDTGTRIDIKDIKTI